MEIPHVQKQEKKKKQKEKASVEGEDSAFQQNGGDQTENLRTGASCGGSGSTRHFTRSHRSFGNAAVSTSPRFRPLPPRPLLPPGIHMQHAHHTSRPLATPAPAPRPGSHPPRKNSPRSSSASVDVRTVHICIYIYIQSRRGVSRCTSRREECVPTLPTAGERAPCICHTGSGAAGLPLRKGGNMPGQRTRGRGCGTGIYM